MTPVLFHFVKNWWYEFNKLGQRLGRFDQFFFLFYIFNRLLAMEKSINTICFKFCKLNIPLKDDCFVRQGKFLVILGEYFFLLLKVKLICKVSTFLSRLTLCISNPSLKKAIFIMCTPCSPSLRPKDFALSVIE